MGKKFTKKDKGHLTKRTLDIPHRFPESVPKRQKFSDDEFLELYRVGASDKWIAHYLGVSRSNVTMRRAKLGLPSNFPQFANRRTGKIDRSMVLFFWIKGMTDEEIGYWLGARQPSIRYHRLKLGLPIQGRWKQVQYMWKKQLIRLIGQLYAECGPKEIADALGVSRKVIEWVGMNHGFTKTDKKWLPSRQLTESEKEELRHLSKPPKKRLSKPDCPKTFTCERCEKEFEALAFNRKYCDACKNIKELHKSRLAYEVWNTRREFYNLAKDDPDKAKKIIGEMMDEGEDIKTILQVADMIIEKLEK